MMKTHTIIITLTHLSDDNVLCDTFELLGQFVVFGLE